MEWSLIKNIDETYFLTNKNLNHVYQYYEFPRLVDGNNFQIIKTEIKVKLKTYIRNFFLIYLSILELNFGKSFVYDVWQREIPSDFK